MINLNMRLFLLLCIEIFILTILFSGCEGNIFTAAAKKFSMIYKGCLRREKCVQDIEKLGDNTIEKYKYLRNLQNENEDAFYKCLINNVNTMLPIVYTPGVAEACQNYGKIPGKRGLTLSIEEDKGKIEEKLRNWPRKDVSAIVVTDGERILGIGDQGANGMGIPVGKMAIYTAFGGVPPQQCLPVTLDVGTNRETYLNDEEGLYVGHKHKRVQGQEYDDFVEEFMKGVVNVFERHTLIQFEDFGNDNAYRLLDKYRDSYTMFNDDIQGTAAVAVAGILAAAKFSGKHIKDSKVFFVGAGTAALGIANLIVDAMGGDVNENRKKIYMKGRGPVLNKNYCASRYEDNDGRRNFCHEISADKNLEDLPKIIEWMRPNILIGVSMTGGIFSQRVLELMGEINDAPIIMPLSNPTAQSECTAEEAYKYTKGKCLFASGSPFPPVEVNGRLHKPQQCNNAYIFPGMALAITVSKMTTVPDEAFLIAAQTLAYKCTEKDDFSHGSLFPTLERLRDCSLMITTDIVEYAIDKGLANMDRNTTDIKTYIQSKMYYPK